jgi:hypothetical protein
MGATESKSIGKGVITVSAGGAVNTPDTAGHAALLQHLQDLRDKVPQMQATIARGEPEEVWRDMEAAKALQGRTSDLEAALSNLLGGYQRWHDEQTTPIVSNQAYVHRLIDQADIKAAKALQHVKQQAAALRTLTAQLDAVQGIPQQLQQLCALAEQLRGQLEQMERETGTAARADAAAPSPVADTVAAGSSAP